MQWYFSSDKFARGELSENEDLGGSCQRMKICYTYAKSQMNNTGQKKMLKTMPIHYENFFFSINGSNAYDLLMRQKKP